MTIMVIEKRRANVLELPIASAIVRHFCGGAGLADLRRGRVIDTWFGYFFKKSLHRRPSERKAA